MSQSKVLILEYEATRNLIQLLVLSSTNIFVCDVFC